MMNFNTVHSCDIFLYNIYIVICEEPPVMSFKEILYVLKELSAFYDATNDHYRASAYEAAIRTILQNKAIGASVHDLITHKLPNIGAGILLKLKKLLVQDIASNLKTLKNRRVILRF
jgi:DNA polymerase/3'-5' exonuclease PolX